MKRLLLAISLGLTACSSPQGSDQPEGQPVLSKEAQMLAGSWHLTSMLLEYQDGRQADFESGDIFYHFNSDKSYKIDITAAGIEVTGVWAPNPDCSVATLFPQEMNGEALDQSPPMDLLINLLTAEELHCQSTDTATKSTQIMTFTKR